MGRALLVLNGPFDRRRAVDWISRAPVGTRVEFKASKRSLPQNDRMWAMLTDVAAHMKKQGRDYTTEEWKLLFMHAWGREVRFLPGLDQKSVVPVGQSSSDLSKEEMTDLIEFIFAWGAENGVTFMDPTVNDNESSAVAPVDDSSEAESQAAAAEPEPDAPEAQDGPDATPAPATLSDDDRAWLKLAAKMLWAATGAGEQELLRRTFDAVRENHTPPEIGQGARDRGMSVYQKCKLVCSGERGKDDTLPEIALTACCDAKETTR